MCPPTSHALVWAVTMIINVATITSAVAIGLLYLFFLYEEQAYDQFTASKSEAIPGLPSREDFLQYRLKNLISLIDDDCIVCRDEPIAPVQTPCNHIFCRDCFMVWINRNHERCPLCTQLLFSNGQRLEKLIKMTAAMTLVSCFLTTLNLVFGPRARMIVVANTIAVFILVAASHKIWILWRTRGPQWWRQYAFDGGEDMEFIWFMLTLSLTWVLYQAVTLGTWLTAHRIVSIWKLFGGI